MIGPLHASDVTLMASGIAMTIALFAGSALMGLLLGVMIGMVRAGEPSTWTRAPRILLAGYSAAFRGIPALVMMLWVFYGPGLVGIRLDPFVAATIALTGYASASMGEIYRASIDSISRDQWLAGRALGMSYGAIMWHIVGPQAIRLSIPPSVGFGAQLLKGTSLASVIGMLEVTRVGFVVASRTYEPLVVFLVVGLIYLGLAAPIAALGSRLEHRMAYVPAGGE